MADVQEVAVSGGFGTALVAITVAIADRILKARAERLKKKLESVAPTETYVPPSATDSVFQRLPSPSAELIARVEGYVRAEGELRVALARKDWELKMAVEERDKALALLRSTRVELEDLQAQVRSGHIEPLHSGHARFPQDHPGRQPADISREPGYHRRSGRSLDRPEDRIAPRKPKTHQDG